MTVWRESLKRNLWKLGAQLIEPLSIQACQRTLDPQERNDLKIRGRTFRKRRLAKEHVDEETHAPSLGCKARRRIGYITSYLSGTLAMPRHGFHGPVANSSINLEPLLDWEDMAS